MASNTKADIVFCIDASGSMQPCIESVRNNIGKLLETIKEESGQIPWDVRFDFLAFQDTKDNIHGYWSVKKQNADLIDSLYKNGVQDNDAFFVRDVDEFCSALDRIQVRGEEEHLLALDISSDYPWRPSDECRRVLVLLSDEPIESGLRVEAQLERMDALINKLIRKHIKLFIVAPDSENFIDLAETPGCVYEVADAQKGGLLDVNFSKFFAMMGKSLSVLQSSAGADDKPCPLWNQQNWGSVRVEDWGKD